MKANRETKRLFVGGLSQAISKTDLQNQFGRFGEVSDVEIITRKDDQGNAQKVFAYVNIRVAEADLKKCMSILNKTKWKGGTLQIQLAKESFLHRLAQEREEAKAKKEKSTTGNTNLLEKMGGVDFHMKAVPGTEVPGHKNWVVSKFGRVLPVLHLKNQHKLLLLCSLTLGNIMKYDPSKYCHNLKKIGEDFTNTIPVTRLTWELEGGNDPRSKKRRGEFSDFLSPPKKIMKVQKSQGSTVSLRTSLVMENNISPQQRAGQKTSHDSITLSKSHPVLDSDAHKLKNILCQTSSLETVRNRNSMSDDDIDSEDELRKMIAKEESLQRTSRSSINDSDPFEVVRDDFKSDVHKLHSLSSVCMNNVSCCVSENMENDCEYDSGDTDEIIAMKNISKVKNSAEFSQKEKSISKKSLKNKELFNHCNKVQKRKNNKQSALSHGVKPINHDPLSDSSSRDNEESEGDEEYKAMIKNCPCVNLTLADLEQLASSNLEVPKDTESSGPQPTISCKFARASKSPKTSRGIYTGKQCICPEEILASLLREENTFGKQKPQEDKKPKFQAFKGIGCLYGKESMKNTLNIASNRINEKQGSLKHEDSNSISIENGLPRANGSPIKLTSCQHTKKTSGLNHIEPQRQLTCETQDHKVVYPNSSEKGTRNLISSLLPLKGKKSLSLSAKIHKIGFDKDNCHGAQQRKESSEEKEPDSSSLISRVKPPKRSSREDTQESLADFSLAVSSSSSIDAKAKPAEDNQKRLAALEARQKAKEAQKKLVHNALANLDGPSQDKPTHIIFGSDSESEMEATSTQKQNLPGEELVKESMGKASGKLFDSGEDEESDSEDDSDRFKIKPQFEGRAGQKLMDLQLHFGSDDRFRMDSRFLESDSEEEQEELNEKKTDEEEELATEKKKALNIVQSVLNISLNNTTSKGPVAAKKFKDVIRYDPTRQDHMTYERTKDDKPKESKAKRKKKREEAEKPPEVSKDMYYNIAADLKEIFQATKDTCEKGEETPWPDEGVRENEEVRSAAAEQPSGKAKRKKKREEAEKPPEVSKDMYYNIAADLKEIFQATKDTCEKGEETPWPDEGVRENEEVRSAAAEQPSGFMFSFFDSDSKNVKKETYKVETVKPGKIVWQEDPRFQDSSSEEEDVTEGTDHIKPSPEEASFPEKETTRFFFFSKNDERLHGSDFFWSGVGSNISKNSWEARTNSLLMDMVLEGKEIVCLLELIACVSPSKEEEWRPKGALQNSEQAGNPACLLEPGLPSRKISQLHAGATVTLESGSCENSGFTFYDGPPFATGLPHYGHILAGTIKDVVTRYAHQSGFHVDRRFGWDCHGLPVEYEIDKTLGIRGPEDVAKMGIAEYNNQCRSIVMRYSSEWKSIITRLGRWIDFDNDYKTLYPQFMESVWWVFKQLYDKGLVYRGVKVMPFSTACNTPLSNFEAHQNYKDVQDPSVFVTFPLEEDENTSLVAWTTTPWTLPSNLALCVNPDMVYVKVKDIARRKLLILMEARLSALYKLESDYEILERFPGVYLKGKKYKPLFDYFLKYKENGAFTVLVDSYVKEEEGTGVVHQAPYFGADDFRVCMDFNIIQKDSLPICPVDASGCFTAEVTHFAGQYVKEGDKNIIRTLKEQGRLLVASTFTHSYPFCWRSDTPLIYKAVPSWFVRVEHMVDKLLRNNGLCYWVPEFVREKRFGNWLKDARDWAISRNRYWGTPIPLWVSDDFEEVVCIGSVAELEELSGAKISDLHRESIDHLTIPSRCGKGPLRRISEVFDCWFESGSMPYAQVHYPFESKREFDDAFPADFIAEGIDQTRGCDGQKMSKRKKNYPDPVSVIQKYGADALRLYLINSPVVRAENLRFKEEGVRDVLKDVLLPWYNAYRFFVQNVLRLHKEEEIEFLYNENTVKESPNITDRWILSFMQSLLGFFETEMAAYRLYTVVPRLVKFVDVLTNWYVRMNRRRLKGENGTEDCVMALETLFSVLLSLCRLMAPYTPFLTELMYQNLKALTDPVSVQDKDTLSIHYLMLPRVREELIDKKTENAVSRMQSVIELGRVIRDRKTIPIKYPLKEIVVIHQDPEALNDISSLEKYILEELNVRKVTLSTDKNKYGIRLRAEPDHMVLGKRLKGAFKSVMTAIKQLKSEELEQFQKTGSIVVEGHELHAEDIRLMYAFDQTTGGTTQYEAHSDAQALVLLDITPDQSMVDEGMAREVINRIQKLRKKLKGCDLEITLTRGLCTPGPVCAYVNLHIYASGKEQDMSAVIFVGAMYLPPPSATGAGQQVAALESDSCTVPLAMNTITRFTFLNEILFLWFFLDGVLLLENPKGDNQLDLLKLKSVVSSIFGVKTTELAVFHGETEIQNQTDLLSLTGKTLCVTAGPAPSPASSPGPLLCQYINLQLLDAEPQECLVGTVGTLLLENPLGQNGLTHQGLLYEAAKVFGLRSRKLKLFLNETQTQEITEDIPMKTLNMKTVYVSVLPTTADC
ncbi:Isoleucyl-tRNA synthetase, cytoplasmic [Fukomys damarensis]|uniref:Nucleolar protein 8 n=2 Tax=Rodentia TaxID=9989 RepID=A0A091CRF4_FUKDA|nr:Isoleucyl-tRNA synthetase, cytoplasmic [Fukomys damarensis]